MKKIIVAVFLMIGIYSIQLHAQSLNEKDTGNKAKINTENVSTGSVTKADNKSTICGKDCKESKKENMWIAWAIVALIIIGFFALVVYSNILRDSVDPDALLANANKLAKYASVKDSAKIPRPFSLSRTQLGIWTVVISSSYIFLSFKCCWQDIEITSSILALLGISAGTAAIGSTIDKSQSSGQQVRHQDQPSEGFLSDILSDANGISIHRFQNVVFTVIAIVIYLYKIPETLCGHLPQLDTTLISLTGISSATYLGLKLNENKGDDSVAGNNQTSNDANGETAAPKAINKF